MIKAANNNNNHDGDKTGVGDPRSEAKDGLVRRSDVGAEACDPGGDREPLAVDPEVLKSCGVALRRMGDGRVESVAVTSTARREGRTTIAIGLAAAAATQGKRTILVDLDFLHRDINNLTTVGAGPGVTEYLKGEASFDDCLQPAGPHLEVLTAGVSSDYGVASEMAGLAYLLTTLRGRCDVVVADLPQLEAGVVTAQMADLFDAVALVVRSGSVAMPAIAQALSVLGQRPYVIFNATGKRSRLQRVRERRS